jgi:hypothetical protein
MFKEEIVGTIEKNHQAFDVCATAEGEFDEANSKLVIELDRFLRIRDIAKQEQPLEEGWMPAKNRVEYSLEKREVVPTVNEVFDFWSKRVRSAIPHPASFIENQK